MKSIFKKQFLTHFTVIVVIFLIFGIGLIKTFETFFINEKKEVLLEQGKNIEKALRRTYEWAGVYNQQILDNEVSILDKYLDASFIFVNQDNKIVIISNDIDSRFLGQRINIKEFSKNSKKKYFQFQGNMGGIFKERVFTVALPVFVDDIKIGTIFMNTPMRDLQLTIQKVYEIIIIFTLIAILNSFILIYIFSKRVTLPLIEICKIAQVISNGNFEKRISINSNDEIGQLSESFNQMAESLFEQEKRRRDFISNISHDIRSPLTSIKGFLQAIIDKTIPENEQEKYIKIVLSEVERLTNLSNNILEINKIHFENNLKYKKFDINELIRKILISLESRIVKKNINISVSFLDETTFVFADIDKIQRVIYNLLDNAIKFTPDKGFIWIETKEDGEIINISIKDNGCGISKEDKKRIFERFYKVDTSRGEDKKGSGLGLSIVKEFILAHNQKIYVKSEKDEGSEFIFTLDKAY